MARPSEVNPQKWPRNTNGATEDEEGKLRNCCFTWNNPDDLPRIEAKLRAWRGVAYMVYGQETSKEGTPHLQGYCEFVNQKTWKSVKNMLEGAHFEARRGTAVGASNYCKKGEQTHENYEFEGTDSPEYGKNAVVVEWGQITDQGKRNDLTPACQMIKEGATLRAVAIEHPEQFVRYHKGMIALKNILITPRSTKPEIRVYWGGRGTGKSYDARKWLGWETDDNPPFVWDPGCKQWFDGYHGEDRIIFEEFRGQLPFGQLLSLTDRYSCKVEYKGGIVQIAATKICFTSPIHPSEWYSYEDLKGDEAVEQLLDRIDDRNIVKYTGVSKRKKDVQVEEYVRF